MVKENELDLTIQKEYFESKEDYTHLANRIYIHTSLGGNVEISNCCFNLDSIINNKDFINWFNDMVGGEMIKIK